MICDVHAHFSPPGLIADLRAGTAIDGMRLEQSGGRTWVVHRQGFRYPLRPESYDVSARLAGMDALGIDVAVVSLSPPLLFYWLDASEAVDWARRANDEIAQLAADSGGRVVGVATLPMQDPDAAAVEARRAVETLGLRGVQISPMIAERTLDEDEFAPVLRYLDESGAPVILHPYFVGAAHRPGLDRYHLSNLVGHPYQTAVGVARLILSGTLDRLRRLRTVCVHGGGFLPYQIGRLDHGHTARADVRGCADLPSSYLQRFWFDTLTHSTDALRYLIGVAGADHVCYGTDFPADMGGGRASEHLAGIDLSPTDTALIEGGNTAVLFGVASGAERGPQWTSA